MSIIRSICCCARRFKRFDLLINRGTKQLCHFIIKSKAGDDDGLTSEGAVGGSAGSVGGQTHHVLAAPITARGNAVNYKLPPVSQVGDERFIRALNSHDGHFSKKQVARSAYDLLGRKWSRA